MSQSRLFQPTPNSLIQAEIETLTFMLTDSIKHIADIKIEKDSESGLTEELKQFFINNKAFIEIQLNAIIQLCLTTMSDLKALIHSDNSEGVDKADTSSSTSEFLYLAEQLTDALIDNLAKLGFPYSPDSAENSAEDLIAMDMAEYCIDLMGIVLIKLWQPSQSSCLKLKPSSAR
jgi:hypothetical protein